MHRRRALAALAATAAAGTVLVAGVTTSEAAGPPKPTPASRVVIVLFDQMLPQYADQFAMPNFRSLRDSGTDFKKAYPDFNWDALFGL